MIGWKAAARGLFRRAANLVRPRTLVLAYHHVCRPGRTAPWVTETPDDFADHMDYLSRTGLAAPLDELLADLRSGRPSHGGRVVVTFDDAAADTYEVALPILRRYGVPATVFVPTGLVGTGRPYWWNRLHLLRTAATEKGIDLAAVGPAGLRWESVRLLADDEREKVLAACADAVGVSTDAAGGPMGWDQLAELDRSGLFTLAAHSVTHPVLGTLSDDRALSELTDSRDAVRRFASFRNVFALPYGDPASRTDRTLALLRRAGFEAVFTTDPLPWSGSGDAMALGRVCLDGTSGRQFAHLIDHYLCG